MSWLIGVLGFALSSVIALNLFILNLILLCTWYACRVVCTSIQAPPEMAEKHIAPPWFFLYQVSPLSQTRSRSHKNKNTQKPKDATFSEHFRCSISPKRKDAAFSDVLYPCVYTLTPPHTLFLGPALLRVSPACRGTALMGMCTGLYVFRCAWRTGAT
jgi:hypothetical protein